MSVLSDTLINREFKGLEQPADGKVIISFDKAFVELTCSEKLMVYNSLCVGEVIESVRLMPDKTCVSFWAKSNVCSIMAVKAKINIVAGGYEE